MKFWGTGRKKAAERAPVQRVSLVSRAVSWVILSTLNLALLTVVAGIGFSVWKYFFDSAAPPPRPDPFSPAAVYASPAPPIDYRQHAPPPGATADVPLPKPVAAAPPLPRAPGAAPRLPGPPLPVAAQMAPRHVPGHPPPHAPSPPSPPLPR